jgi:hypothetical protein
MATSFYKLSLGLIFILAISACRKDPNWDKVPHIEYEGYVQRTLEGDFGNIYDEITLAVRFRDGDGDLGLQNTPSTHEDLQPPFQFLNEDNTPNPNYYNYFIDTFIKRDGVFVPYQFPNQGFTYNGRYMRLNPDNRIEPLEGTLRYTLPEWYATNQVRQGTIVKFRITIADRALNRSNTVETEEIALFTKRQ